MGATVSRAEPDLTHSVGGPVMYDGVGQLDNAEPEARPDFLTFTAEPLTEPLDVVGVPRVGLYVRGTAPTTDFFVRLCDVTPRGASLNLTEQRGVAPPWTKGLPSGQILCLPPAPRAARRFMGQHRSGWVVLRRWCRMAVTRCRRRGRAGGTGWRVPRR
jgi:hypothetical protein